MNFESHIGITAGKGEFFSEHFECMRIILAEVIGVSTIVEVNTFFVRHHFAIPLGSHVVIIIA